MNDQIDEIRTEIEREKIARDILGVADIAYEYLIIRKCGSRYAFFRNGIVRNKGSSSIYCESGYFRWWKMAFF